MSSRTLLTAGLDHLLLDEAVLVLECRDCGGERLFAPVDCLDGHDDCPERACLGCGSAVLLSSRLPTAVGTDASATAELLSRALPARSVTLDESVEGELARSGGVGRHGARASRLVG